MLEGKRELETSLQMRLPSLLYHLYRSKPPLSRNVRSIIELYIQADRTPSGVAKRAEVKPCPVCEELIPIRLLPVHLDLELKRVEDIIKAVGSSEVLQDADDQDEGFVINNFAQNTRRT